MADLPYPLVDSDTLPEYRYRSLQGDAFEADIRLLHLQPGSGIDPIVCTIFAVSFRRTLNMNAFPTRGVVATCPLR